MNKKAITMLTMSGVIALTGCSGGEAPKDGAAAGGAASGSGKVEISVSSWGAPDERKVFEAVLQDFEKANPNIKVKFQHIPSDYSVKLNTMIAGGKAPDVIFTTDGDFPRWVKQGAFLNIDEMVKASGKLDLNDMWETGLNRYRYDGKVPGKGSLYALPKDIGPSVMYYNKDLFDKYKVPYPSADKPMSWEDALAMWKKLTIDENGDGKTDIYGSGPSWWEGFVWSNNGDVLSKDRKEFTLNKPEGAKAMQFAYDLINAHKVVPDARALQSMNDGQMFEAGKLATITGGRWQVPTYRKLKFNWDVAPIPSATGSWVNGWSGSVGLGVNAKTKFPNESYKLVEWFAGKEGQTKMTELGFSIPNFKSMSNTDVFLQPGQKPEHASVFIKAAENQQAGPWTYLPNPKWSDTFNQKLAEFWVGTEPAQAFLDKMKPIIDKEIQEGNPEVFK
ncbi:ABC transporter substrate-binding protein [Paenibacillus mucilaginosus]|uniref:Extracellular solute-binding protein family 1 n=1 Tax=Paenibacillus mucilaginosus (strain KNP414) TaxID=1036673 RepID=F8FE94_PAEMK|nr:sugar ABC transporter substrate-binding protein [Paenibacillus mucilaginosus]AEI43853.1 hypothetical protein KNP414_05329 [Paenibacillus mucilaginosus KNP414]MCG7212635.1 sugar ABC transporter substrate-binding protein [Paenibacillus mucilaginosus]WDM25344.1 sugar ABC transporter substrate-binding protein [Paenibacillus mucilaginosus]